MPVRQRLHQNGHPREYVPLLSDLGFSSYQSTTDNLLETPRQPGSSDVATTRRGSTAQNTSVSQQTDSDQSKYPSNQQDELPSEEPPAPSSAIQGTHDDTSGSSPSSTPIYEI